MLYYSCGQNGHFQFVHGGYYDTFGERKSNISRVDDGSRLEFIEILVKNHFRTRRLDLSFYSFSWKVNGL